MRRIDEIKDRQSERFVINLDGDIFKTVVQFVAHGSFAFQKYFFESFRFLAIHPFVNKVACFHQNRNQTNL